MDFMTGKKCSSEPNFEKKKKYSIKFLIWTSIQCLIA